MVGIWLKGVVEIESTWIDEVESGFVFVGVVLCLFEWFSGL
jgi:hypothetical protein